MEKNELDFENAKRCDDCKLPMKYLRMKGGGGSVWSCRRCNLTVTVYGQGTDYFEIMELVAMAIVILVIFRLFFLYATGS